MRRLGRFGNGDGFRPTRPLPGEAAGTKTEYDGKANDGQSDPLAVRHGFRRREWQLAADRVPIDHVPAQNTPGNFPYFEDGFLLFVGRMVILSCHGFRRVSHLCTGMITIQCFRHPCRVRMPDLIRSEFFQIVFFDDFGKRPAVRCYCHRLIFVPLLVTEYVRYLLVGVRQVLFENRLFFVAEQNRTFIPLHFVL